MRSDLRLHDNARRRGRAVERRIGGDELVLDGQLVGRVIDGHDQVVAARPESEVGQDHASVEHDAVERCRSG